jgi:DnaJ-class molecular chaperone
MSKMKQMIVIEPPTGSGSSKEHFFLCNSECPTCHGRGYNITYEGRECRQDACKRCSGTGVLCCEISIGWSAGEEPLK